MCATLEKYWTSEHHEELELHAFLHLICRWSAFAEDKHSQGLSHLKLSYGQYATTTEVSLAVGNQLFAELAEEKTV